MDLLRQNPVKGAEIFDRQIAATMQANGIDRIYTFDTGFQTIPSIETSTPK